MLFIPFSVVSGLLAGLLGKKIFDALWGLFDDQEPTEAEHREVHFKNVLAAAAIQGASVRATRAAVHHQSRRAFAGITGSWPGEEAPEPE